MEPHVIDLFAVTTIAYMSVMFSIAGWGVGIIVACALEIFDDIVPALGAVAGLVGGIILGLIEVLPK